MSQLIDKKKSQHVQNRLKFKKVPPEILPCSRKTLPTNKTSDFS